MPPAKKEKPPTTQQNIENTVNLLRQGAQVRGANTLEATIAGMNAAAMGTASDGLDRSEPLCEDDEENPPSVRDLMA